MYIYMYIYMYISIYIYISKYISFVYIYIYICHFVAVYLYMILLGWSGGVVIHGSTEPWGVSLFTELKRHFNKALLNIN